MKVCRAKQNIRELIKKVIISCRVSAILMFYTEAMNASLHRRIMQENVLLEIDTCEHLDVS